MKKATQRMGLGRSVPKLRFPSGLELILYLFCSVFPSGATLNMHFCLSSIYFLHLTFSSKGARSKPGFVYCTLLANGFTKDNGTTKISNLVLFSKYFCFIVRVTTHLIIVATNLHPPIVQILLSKRYRYRNQS